MLPRLRWHAESIARQARTDATCLGLAAALALAVGEVEARVRGQAGPARRAVLRGYRHPIHFRPGTSDRDVLTQVLGEQEYGCVAAEANVRTILDLGGNIGLTAFYLLGCYPAARLTLVEPDRANLAVARRTLAPFARRVRCVPAGVWGEATDLVVERGGFRDGKEWAYQTRPNRPDERSEFRAVTLPQLLTLSRFDRVDLLKIDIESAERSLFGAAARPDEWLARVGTLVIETHGPECERIVDEACAPFRPAVTRVGLLTVYRFPGRAA